MIEYLADIEKIKQAKLDIAPLLDSVAQGGDLIRQCLIPDMHPEARSQIENVLQLITERKAEFAQAYDAEIPALQKGLHESLDTIAMQMQAMEAEIKKSQDFLENNPPLPDLSSDPGKNPFHPDNLQASIPATLPGLAEKVLPLSGGSVLVSTLLTFKTDTDLRNEAGTRHMRTSGNIWENWKGPNQ